MNKKSVVVLEDASLEVNVTITETGPRGLQGEQGIQGPKGDKGDTGEQGIQGLQGEKGEKGDDGYTPVKGVDYFDGEQGPKGDKGDTGEQGIQGPKGDKGDTGEQGIQGPKGDKGDKGDTGEVDYTILDLKADITYVDSQDALKADKTYVDGLITDLLGSAPATLDTLNELADALGNDPNFATTITNSLATKANKTEVNNSLELKADQTYVDTQDELKADKTYVDSKVQTDVPSGAKFTDTTYTGGTNVTISGTTINAVNTTYTAGTNMSLTGTVFSAIDTVPTKSNVESALGYSINSSVPSGAKFTDTVYSHPSSHPASMITESSTQRFVSDSEKLTWNSKSDTDTVTTINGKTGAITKADITALGIPAQDTVVDISGKAEKTYVDNKVLTDVPSGAKFTDTITTINGKTGTITKADITALGIPAQDTVYTHPTTHSVSEISGLQTALDDKVDDSQVLTNVPLNAKFTDTITTINGKTGIIAKADIVALGIPAQDTVYTHPPGTNPHGTTKSDVGLGDVTNDKQMPISGGVLENYREKLVTLSGTSTTIDLSLANVFAHSLIGNTTYSITNAVNEQAHSFTLIINQTATVRALTFPASVRWQGGEMPDMTTANKIYILTFMTINGGTNWLGMSGGEF